VLTAVLMWGAWNSLSVAAATWDNPLYSHGYLIPLFALVLLWMRREPIQFAAPREMWAGLALLGLGLGLRVYFTYTAIITVELYSFIPCLAGVFLLVGGWPLLRWAGPPIAFLVFMFPLPTPIKTHVLERLQYVATVCSTFVLQTMGVPAYCEGNRISIGELQLGVVDACSGLRMSTNLLALVVAIVLVTRQTWWERLLILASAIPIALVVNVVRIVITALCHMYIGSEAVNAAFHDWAGLAMMPLALLLLFAEIEILSRLVLEEDDGRHIAAASLAGRPAPRQPGL
jgi:exosortase